jgi:predicted nucleotidyltransferase
MQKLDLHSQWRLALAQQVSERLSPYAGIQAMAVGGSVARGFADVYSDLEILLFWDKLPNDEARHAIISALQADFLYPYNGPAQEDNLLIKGFQVDLWHATVTAEDAVIASVLNNFTTDLGAGNFMDTIQSCIPLTGGSIIARWKKLAAEYPTELAVRNIQIHLENFDLKQLDLALQRDNPTLFYHTLSNVQASSFMVLLALNRTYYPTLKWIYPTLNSFAIAPTELIPRLRRMFQIPPAQALVEMRSILMEILDLIVQYHPQIDVALARFQVQHVRTAIQVPVRL